MAPSIKSRRKLAANEIASINLKTILSFSNALCIRSYFVCLIWIFAIDRMTWYDCTGLIQVFMDLFFIKIKIRPSPIKNLKSPTWIEFELCVRTALTFGSDPLPSVKYAAGADTLYFSQFGWSVFSRLKLQQRFYKSYGCQISATFSWKTAQFGA